jgi:hypothetical protein
MTLDDEDDKETLAAEYVLGTLDPHERAEAQALIAVDREFGTSVRLWERRLGELNVLVAPVEPPAEIWNRIKAEMGAGTNSAHKRLLGNDLPHAAELSEAVEPRQAPPHAAEPAQPTELPQPIEPSPATEPSQPTGPSPSQPIESVRSPEQKATELPKPGDHPPADGLGSSRTRRVHRLLLKSATVPR